MPESDHLTTISLIGVGNDFRGDDAAGLAVARKIRNLSLPGIEVLESRGDPGHLIRLWHGAGTTILVDAMHSAAKPGTIRRFEVGAEPLPAGVFAGHSTHSLGVAEALELARALDQLPARLIVYGIEGKSYTPGAVLSPEVSKAADEAVDRILKDLQSLLRAPEDGR